MVHKVGIVGVTGNIGAPTAKTLIAAAEQGKIDVVIFHRASTNLSALSRGPNVEFRILNFDDPLEKIEEAVKGINVFVSAVGFEGVPSEAIVVDALAKSPDLVTYIPSTFSTTWAPEDFSDDVFGPLLKFVHQGWDRAVEKGIAVTPVYTGVFDVFWFQIGFIIPPVKDNIVWASKEQLKNAFPISAAEHIAQAITRIATADPHTVKNQSYSAVTFWPTGQEIVDLYSKIHGKPSQLKDYTNEDREGLRDKEKPTGAGHCGYRDRWTENSWKYDQGGRIVDTEYEGPGLEEMARRYAEA